MADERETVAYTFKDIPTDQLEDFRALAKEQHRSLQGQFLHLLETEVRKYRRRRDRRQL